MAEKTLGTLRQELQTLERKTELVKDDLRQQELALEIEQKRLEVARKNVELEQQLLEITKKTLEVLEKGQIVDEQALKSQREIVKQRQLDYDIALVGEEELLEKQQKRKETQKEINKAQELSKTQLGHLKTQLSEITGVHDKWNGHWFAGGILLNDWGSTFNGIFKDVGGTLKGIGKTVSTMGLNIVGTGLQAIAEGTKELIKLQDQVVSSFAEATGTGHEYREMITDLGKENLTLGINTGDASKAILALRERFTGFTMLSKSAQKDMALFTATMEKLGVDSSVTAENMQIMTKGMGLTADQSIKAQKEIAATAKALNVNIGAMADQFAQAGRELAVFGKQGVAIFRKLAVQAKNTGIEVNRLLALAKQFDTFEGAADAVGRLNAILGGNFLDSMQMIATTDPAERIKMLRGALDQAGLSFKTMGYYQKQAIADTMGLKDVAELSELMSKNLNKNSAAAKEAALSQAKLADMAKKAQSMAKKWEQVWTSFAVSLQPVLDILRGILEWITKANDALGGWFIPTLFVAMAVLIKLKGIGLASILISKAKTVATMAETAALSAKNKVEMASTAGTAAAAPKFLLFAAAIFLVAAGLGVLFIGISMVIDSLTGFFSMLIKSNVNLFEFSAGIIALSVAMLMMLPGAVAAGLGLTILAAGMALLALSLALIKTDDLVALMTMFDAMSKFTNNTVSNVNKVASAIGNIAKAIEKIPTEKAITFAATMDYFQGASATAAQHKGAVEGAKTAAIATAAAGASGAAAKAGAPASAPGAGNRTIVLELDGHVLDKYIINVLNKELNPRKL